MDRWGFNAAARIQEAALDAIHVNPWSAEVPKSSGKDQNDNLIAADDGINVWLRYGDTVSLLPEGTRGVMAFAGAADGRPWVSNG
jgi:hypothetical protein